jgi:hypothetical protein
MLASRVQSAVLAGVVGLLVACEPALQQREWEKSETLWRGQSGNEFALYHLPSGLSRDPEAYGCESHFNGRVARKIVPLSDDVFPMVVGDTAYIFDLKNRATPGWYRLTRNHNLNWWQRNIYTDESLGEWTVVEQPRPISIGDAESSRGGVYLLEGARLRKVADEKDVSSLWDVPAEGTLYVAEPGIGVTQILDLKTLCRE